MGRWAQTVSWPAYSLTTDQHLELGDVISVGSGLYKHASDLAGQVGSQVALG